MDTGTGKTDRILELFFRAIKGENLSVQTLANEYNVSTRSISRDINALKNYLAEHREKTGYAELIYSSKTRSYHLHMDEFITNPELLALTKALIGCRALSASELATLVDKLKSHTTCEDREKLDILIRNELYNYNEIHFECDNITRLIWEITNYIYNRQCITITYYKMNHNEVKHRIMPVSVMFSEYYYYLIAYKCEGRYNDTPRYFRIDRIINIVVHREHFRLPKGKEINEGLIRKRSQFMFPGKLRRIIFEFSGPSVQAVLDRIPTAVIVGKNGNTYTIEAEVYGDGIRMFLLSQGTWVKVLAPQEFVNEMKEEIEGMIRIYS